MQKSIEKKDFILDKSNFAIKISSGMNVVTRKIFDLMLYCLQKDEYVNNTVEIPLKWIYAIHGTSVQSKSKIKKATQDLFKCISLNNNKFEGWKGVSCITYAKIEDTTLVMNVNPKLKEMLTYNGSIKSGGYTKMILPLMKHLNSIHSLAFYETIKKKYSQQKFNHNIEITVKELREELNCIASYPDFYEFNRSVIQPAIQAINMHTDLRIKSEKDAKSPYSINFIVTKKTDEEIESIPKQEKIINVKIEPTYSPKAKVYAQKQSVSRETKENFTSVSNFLDSFEMPQMIEPAPAIIQQYEQEELEKPLQDLIDIGILTKIAKQFYLTDKRRIIEIYRDVMQNYANKTNEEKCKIIVVNFRNGVDPVRNKEVNRMQSSQAQSYSPYATGITAEQGQAIARKSIEETKRQIQEREENHKDSFKISEEEYNKISSVYDKLDDDKKIEVIKSSIIADFLYKKVLTDGIYKLFSNISKHYQFMIKDFMFKNNLLT